MTTSCHCDNLHGPRGTQDSKDKHACPKLPPSNPLRARGKKIHFNLVENLLSTTIYLPILEMKEIRTVHVETSDAGSLLLLLQIIYQ